MPDYAIEGFVVNAPDQETAKRLVEYVKKQGEGRYLIIETKGEFSSIKFAEDSTTRIYSSYRNTIQNSGEVHGGSGNKILQTAVDSVNISNRQIAKVASAVKKSNRETRHNLEQKDIDEFESSIPMIAKALYADVMRRVDASSAAYKLEIVSELCTVGIKSDNWIPILTWFRDKVLVDEEAKEVSERRTFFQLRKAFVTTAIRIAKNDVRNGNTMKLVMRDKTKIDWVKYAEDNQRS